MERQMKTKACILCRQLVRLAYRYQIAPSKTWQFACGECLSLEKMRPGYRYGGTWNGARH